MYQGVSTKAAEHRKHTENDPSGLSQAGNVSRELQGLMARGTEGILTGGFSVSHSW